MGIQTSGKGYAICIALAALSPPRALPGSSSLGGLPVRAVGPRVSVPDMHWLRCCRVPHHPGLCCCAPTVLPLPWLDEHARYDGQAVKPPGSAGEYCTLESREHFMQFLGTHPFALAGFILAIIYAWSILGNPSAVGRVWNAKRLVRTFVPSVAVIVMVIAVSGGLKRTLTQVDFGMFYSSALLLQNEPQNLYDQTKQTEYLHAVTGLAGKAHYLPFAYPPFVALMFAPLTALSFRSAYFVLLAVNIALLIFSLWWLLSRLHYSREHTIAFLVIASGVLPLYAVLVLGHLTLLGITILTLFVTDVLGAHKMRAGLWAGLLLFKPILFPIPLFILLWKKQWKAVVLFLGVGLGLLLISYALVGWDGLKANAAMLFVMTSDYLLPRTQSLRGLAFAVGMETGAWILLAGILTLVLWFAVARARNQRWILAAAMMAIMLVPPYLQFHDLAICLIGLALGFSTMTSISDRTRNILFITALVPPAIVLAGPRDHPVFPIMPVLLSFLFAFCIVKSFRDISDSDYSN